MNSKFLEFQKLFWFLNLLKILKLWSIPRNFRNFEALLNSIRKDSDSPGIRKFELLKILNPCENSKAFWFCHFVRFRWFSIYFFPESSDYSNFKFSRHGVILRWFWFWISFFPILFPFFFICKYMFFSYLYPTHDTFYIIIMYTFCHGFPIF